MQFRRDFDATFSCEDPPRVVNLVGVDQQTWYPEIPCTQYQSQLELHEDEERMNFWACIPLENQWYESRNGMTCGGPINTSTLRLNHGNPCVFPLWVELTNQGDLVFEFDETLFLEPNCGIHYCFGEVPVTVNVRAVPRWNVTSPQPDRSSPESP